MNRSDPRSDDRRTSDRGSVLILVLVMTVVLSLIVVGLATYTTTTLRYGRTVEEAALRLAAANGAMENMLEAMERGQTQCIAPPPGGVSFPLGGASGTVSINGIAPEVHCEYVSGGALGVEQYAIVLTGGSAASNPLLAVRGAADEPKTITGPLYMARTPDAGNNDAGVSLALEAPLQINQGDLRYTNATCPGVVDLVNTGPKQVTFETGYTTDCVTAAWASLFPDQPTQPSGLGTMAIASAPNEIKTGPGNKDYCVVWEPGRYTNPPNLTAFPSNHQLNGYHYHFFKSGEYYFDFNGQWNVTTSWVLMGGPRDPGSFPGVPGGHNNQNAEQNPCKSVWESDSRQGATVFMGGSSNIQVAANAALEITGRDQGNFRVSLQTTSTSTADGNATIVSTDGGNNHQLAIRGLLWAPNRSLLFSGITNTAVAVLSGGAVVSKLDFDVSGSASGFAIGVDGTPAQSRIALTTTATNTGTTSIRTVLQYRPDDTSVAVLSRRVMDRTPE